ncbi:MAG: 1-acyl-sn-glycerol-3-phosphate acyltransferase [Lachnospiraceae bacterium]|nr:1-acyl-sn-glycerol-3-phosphate acyltransferase [Lachnospiraceae bacterium]
MLRLIFVCSVSMPFILYYLFRAGYIDRHDDKYTESDRYKIARRMVGIMKHNGLIKTNVYGKDNLPKNGGYVMYANHQGKYDSLGIISAHENPCTVMIDEKRSHLFLTDQFVTLLKGSRLDKTDMKNQMQTVLNVIAEVKEGRRYIIFPEGGYCHNRNEVHEFMPGAFKCAIKSKSPIIPVALIDSYKPFELTSIRPVTTQVHFLEPLYYEDYKDLNSIQIAKIVRDRIIAAIRDAGK